MNIRGNKSIVAAIVGVVVVAIAAAAFFYFRAEQHADDVKDADRAAATFQEKLDSFTASLSQTLKDGDTDDPAGLEAAVHDQLDSAPRLGGVSSYGREHSDAYARAVKDEKALAPRLEELSKALGEAAKGQAFVKAARTVLKVRPNDFITVGPMSSGDPIRKKLIPGYTSALAAFDKAEVPQGQEKVAAQVHDAISFVIGEAGKLADRLDARQSYGFTFADKYDAAGEAIDEYAATVKKAVESAVAAINA